MAKYIYDGWYQGINGDENRYALLIDKETRVGYIYPRSKDELDDLEMFTYNEPQSDLYVDIDENDNQIKTMAILNCIGVGICLLGTHLLISKSNGYSKMANWTKKNFNNIKSKFKNKAE